MGFHLIIICEYSALAAPDLSPLKSAPKLILQLAGEHSC